MSLKLVRSENKGNSPGCPLWVVSCRKRTVCYRPQQDMGR